MHRDLKPSNVLVSLDGPQVIDFGVSRAVERITLTATREALGTPAYMAPEQARESRRTSAASDVFSLGSTLMYAATGHAPYRGETTMDVLVRLATEPPDLSGLPPELAGTIAPCLDRDPAARPTPAALLAGIAATLRYDEGDGDGARSLPAGALGLIEQYRRRPAPAPGPADADSTFGSRPSLPVIPEPRPAPTAVPPTAVPPATVPPATVPPATVPPATVPPALTPPSVPPGPPAAADAPAAAPEADPGRHRWGTDRGSDRGTERGTDRRILVALLALAAVVLAGGGIALGTVLGNGGTGTAAQQTGQPPGPPPDGPPPPPRDPADIGSGAGPKLVVNQPHGDKLTHPTLQGTGWAPGTSVTVRVAGGPTSPVHPSVDRSGSFNYTVNQTGELYPGGLPARGTWSSS